MTMKSVVMSKPWKAWQSEDENDLGEFENLPQELMQKSEGELMRDWTRDGSTDVEHVSAFECLFCKGIFGSEEHISAHLLQRHSVFRISDTYFRIIPIHRVQLRFQCKVCGRILASRSGYYQHVLCVHSNDHSQYKCVCGLTFKANFNRLKHARKKHPNCYCSSCDVAFKSWKEFFKHKPCHDELLSKNTQFNDDIRLSDKTSPHSEHRNIVCYSELPDTTKDLAESLDINSGSQTMVLKRLVEESITSGDKGEANRVLILSHGVHDTTQQELVQRARNGVKPGVQSDRETINSAMDEPEQLSEDHFGYFDDGAPISGPGDESRVPRSEQQVVQSAINVRQETGNIHESRSSESQITEVHVYKCSICNKLFDSDNNAHSHIIQKHTKIMANNKISQIDPLTARNILAIRAPVHQMRFKCPFCGVILSADKTLRASYRISSLKQTIRLHVWTFVQKPRLLGETRQNCPPK